MNQIEDQIVRTEKIQIKELDLCKFTVQIHIYVLIKKKPKYRINTEVQIFLP